jgi:hypothetical protein
VVLNRHSSVFEVVLERLLKYFADLLVSLILTPPARDQMTIDDHESLIIKLKTYADSALVACCAKRPCLDLANLERLCFHPVAEFSFDEDYDVAADHAFLDVHEVLLELLDLTLLPLLLFLLLAQLA